MLSLVAVAFLGAPHAAEPATHTTASIEGMLAAATDFEGIPSWSSADLLDSEALSGTNPVDFFQVLDSPFPVKDRYWFLRGTTVRAADGTTEFRWQHLDPELAVR